MIKIGIDPSGTGTTAIVVFKNGKLIDKEEIKNKIWIEHSYYIKSKLEKYKNPNLYIEDCLYTTANGSKDRDDLLRLLGSLYSDLFTFKIKFNRLFWVSPRYTKSIVKNMENLSKYNNSWFSTIQYFSKDENLTYEYGKGWKYNNEKISNHLRDAIIIANYESK